MEPQKRARVSVAAGRNGGVTRKQAVNKAWRLAHREERLAYLARYYAAHQHAARLYAAEWRKRNREAHRASVKASYLKRPDARRAQRKAHDLANAATVRQSQQAYRLSHLAQVRAKNKRWIAANRGRFNALVAKRNAAKLRATPVWADRAAIDAIYAEAARRTRETGIAHAVDHYYPLLSPVVCGLHVEHNLRVITRSENSKKKNHLPITFVRT